MKSRFPRLLCAYRRAAFRADCRYRFSWYDDPKFRNRAGSPATLPIEGTSGATFRQLCELYSGGVYYQTL
jgi:hypothetical protein